MPIAIATRYLNAQENKYSTNELELIAEVWSVDRFKNCLLVKGVYDSCVSTQIRQMGGQIATLPI